MTTETPDFGIDGRRTIWKFPFWLSDVALVAMPKGSQLLHVGLSNTTGGDMCVWAMVCPGSPNVLRLIRVYGTGHPCDPLERHENYLGTVAMGSLIFHVFDGGEVVEP